MEYDPRWRLAPLPAEWTVLRGLDTYLAENGFDREGYEAAWTPASLLGLRLNVPNTRKHRWALMRHDLHHVATGYGTDLRGEAEVSAWESASGLPNVGLYTQTIVRSLASTGLALWPRRTLAAWRASRAPNLFHDPLPYEALLALSIGELRALLGISEQGLAGARELHDKAPRSDTRAAQTPTEDSMTTLYNFHARSMDGSEFAFDTLRGKVVLVVNTASQCGFTPHFEGLEALWKRYREQGLAVVGFPCNQFGAQDPGSNGEILTFCQKNYGVTFAMMEKVEVNGSHTHPLYKWLKAELPGILGSEAIKWNFTKFLLDRQGRPLQRYAPNTKPEALRADIEAALKAR